VATGLVAVALGAGELVTLPVATLVELGEPVELVELVEAATLTPVVVVVGGGVVLVGVPLELAAGELLERCVDSVLVSARLVGRSVAALWAACPSAYSVSGSSGSGGSAGAHFDLGGVARALPVCACEVGGCVLEWAFASDAGGSAADERVCRAESCAAASCLWCGSWAWLAAGLAFLGGRLVCACSAGVTAFASGSGSAAGSSS